MCCSSQSQAPEPKETEFSKTLAEIMRERNVNARKFQPLENQLIGSVQQFQSPEFARQETGKAMAGVESAFGAEKARSDAELAGMGVNPGEGAYADRNLKLSLGRTLGRAGAFRAAGDSARRLGYDTLAAVSGRGDAKVGQAISAAGTGAQDYTNRQSNQMRWQQYSEDMSGLGQLAGTLGSAMIMSSKKVKKDITPVKNATARMRQMPAKNWTYKGDDEEHVGPMAEDFQKATGKGNGRTLSLPDLVGVQHAAITELDKRVNQLERKKGK